MLNSDLSPAAPQVGREPPHRKTRVMSTRRRFPTNWVSGRTLQPSIESVVANPFVPSSFLMDGQVSGLGTVHPFITLGFFSTWILPLLVVSCFQRRRGSRRHPEWMDSKEYEIPTYIKDNGIYYFFFIETQLSAHDDDTQKQLNLFSSFDMKSSKCHSRYSGGGMALIYNCIIGSNITYITAIDLSHTLFEVVQTAMNQQYNTTFFCLYRFPSSGRNNLIDSIFTEHQLDFQELQDLDVLLI